MRPKGVVIRDLIDRVVLVGATVVHTSQAEGFMVRTPAAASGST